MVKDADRVKTVKPLTMPLPKSKPARHANRPVTRQLPRQSRGRENGLSLLMLGMVAKIRARLARRERRKKTSHWRRRVNWQANCAPRAR
jgi:hypothetical protein